MCLVNYELATQLYNDDTRHDEIKSVEQVKREVNEIISKSTLTDEPLTEQGAFMEWLEQNGIKKEYLAEYRKLKKVKKMENSKSNSENGIKEISSEKITLEELKKMEMDEQSKYFKLGDGDNMYFTIPKDTEIIKRTLQGKYGQFVVYDIEICRIKGKIGGKVISTPSRGIYGFKEKQIIHMKKYNFEGTFRLARQGTGTDTRYVIEHESEYDY